MEIKNILVTGGAGFIGSNFVKYMLNKGRPDCRIVNLDKLTYAGNLENLKNIESNPNYTFVKGDICDFELVNKVVKENNIDTIVHFAAESHVDRSINDPFVFVKTNVLGTQTLLVTARVNGNLRFHHISTDEVFGELGTDGYFNENSPPRPNSPYSASKAASDHVVRAYFKTYSLPITISNCSNNYGPNQYPEKILPLFITNLIDGKKVPLYGDGSNVRDWLHVLDHCRAVDLVLHKGRIGETYCVGGGCEKSNLELTQLILTEFGLGDSQIERVDDRKGHDFRYAIDFDKIKQELGWSPEIDFETGLKDTIKWYRENESWWRPLKK